MYDLTDDEVEALVYTALHSATGFAPGGGSTGDFYAQADQREYGRTALARADAAAKRIGCLCPKCRKANQ
jgi:hypothetical protein